MRVRRRRKEKKRRKEQEEGQGGVKRDQEMKEEGCADRKFR